MLTGNCEREWEGVGVRVGDSRSGRVWVGGWVMVESRGATKGVLVCLCVHYAQHYC